MMGRVGLSVLSLAAFAGATALILPLRYELGIERQPTYCADESNVGAFHSFHTLVYQPIKFIATWKPLGDRDEDIIASRAKAQQKPEAKAASEKLTSAAKGFRADLSPLGPIGLTDVKASLAGRCPLLEQAGFFKSTFADDDKKTGILGKLKQGDLAAAELAYLNPGIREKELIAALDAHVYSGVVRKGAKDYADAVLMMERHARENSPAVFASLQEAIAKARLRDKLVQPRHYLIDDSLRVKLEKDVADARPLVEAFVNTQLPTQELINALNSLPGNVVRHGK
jgi:hypothetical protein